MSNQQDNGRPAGAVLLARQTLLQVADRDIGQLTHIQNARCTTPRCRVAGLIGLGFSGAAVGRGDDHYACPMSDFMQVVTTVDSEEAAEQLARSITAARLAACVQIVGPIRSLYWWQGELDDAREWQLVMKTTIGRLLELEQHIKANHSYETPEITATEIPWGSREYLDWISAETRTGASS